MDFCGHMSDIEAGLKNGPGFCAACAARLGVNGSGFLLELARAAKEFRNLDAADREVAEAFVSRGKRYAGKDNRFDYDVVLSFAGPDRANAKLLARALEEKDVSVFYDEDQDAALWGKNIQIYLSEQYRLRARFCIVLLSEHYSRSPWTRVELEAALAREFEQGNEYVLPVRLDQTQIPGILPTRSFLVWQDHTPAEIVERVRRKLAKAAGQEYPDSGNLH